MTQLHVGAADGTPVFINAGMLTRHGLICGATGTGKTVTLQVLSEQLSRAGVSVFTSDVKGDLAGIAAAGEPSDKLAARATEVGADDYVPEATPTTLWDIHGEKGIPVRTTILEFGPVLLSRVLDCSDAQADALHMIYSLADDQQWPLVDLDDLSAVTQYLLNNEDQLDPEYQGFAGTTLRTLQRKIAVLADEGGNQLFGEPAFELEDTMRKSFDGRGMVHVLSATKLLHNPRYYSTFLLWLLAELFDEMPEVGDIDQPKLVFFFDEAHLLFRDAPKPLLEKIETVVRLIRSKGVGIVFVTQSPADIPSTVRGQLGLKVIHGLRAFTPEDMKAVKAAADSLRENPDFDTEEALSEIGVGEALVSSLDEKGIPTIVERVKIRPPRCRMGALTEAERASMIQDSLFMTKYGTPVNRDSAYEILQRKIESAPKPELEAVEPESGSASESTQTEQERNPFSIFTQKNGRRQSYAETMLKQVMRTAGNKAVNQVFKSIFK